MWVKQDRWKGKKTIVFIISLFHIWVTNLCFVNGILPCSLSPQACFMCMFNMSILYFHKGQHPFRFSLKLTALSNYAFFFPLDNRHGYKKHITLFSTLIKITAISDDEWQLAATVLRTQQTRRNLGKLDCLCPQLREGRWEPLSSSKSLPCRNISSVMLDNLLLRRGRTSTLKLLMLPSTSPHPQILL